MLAVLPVGLLPVFLLTLLAAVEEDLAPSVSQSNLVLLLLPLVHLTVCTIVSHETTKQSVKASEPLSGHPDERQTSEAK